MKEIIISKNMYDKLKPISFEHERVCYLNTFGEMKILKKFPFNEEYKEDYINTVKLLDENKEFFSKEFILPEALVKYKDAIIGFTTKKVNDTSLSNVLKSKILIEEKIAYLKKLGTILRKCDEIRKNVNFALTDLHEENILIDSNNLYLIDLDSIKINDNLVKPARYMQPSSLASNTLKYKKNSNSFIIPNRDTEIYNYIIIILNYILKLDVAYMEINDFKNALNFLESFNFNKELIDIFNRIITDKANENPDYLLDTISEKTLKKIHKHEFCKEIKRTFK